MPGPVVNRAPGTTRSRQLGAEPRRVREQTSHSARDLARAQSHNLYVEDPGDVCMYRDCLRKLRGGCSG